jgi:uncharacterized membrane protein
VSPDTIQNTTIAIRLLIQHNFFAIIFFLGIIISTAAALYKPKRAFILFMIGFSLLLLGFEYQKHIKDALFEQTKSSIITERPSYRLERIISVSILKVAPLALEAAGFLSIGAGAILLIVSRPKRNV